MRGRVVGSRGLWAEVLGLGVERGVRRKAERGGGRSERYQLPIISVTSQDLM